MKFTNKTATEVVKLIKGKKVKIISANSGHGYPIGSIIEVKTAIVAANGTGANSITLNGKNWVYVTEIESLDTSKADLEQELLNLAKDKDILEAKLKYLDQTNQDEFDETEFKVWNTLQLLKGKKNDLDKAKAIAALINS